MVAVLVLSLWVCHGGCVSTESVGMPWCHGGSVSTESVGMPWCHGGCVSTESVGMPWCVLVLSVGGWLC